MRWPVRLTHKSNLAISFFSLISTPKLRHVQSWISPAPEMAKCWKCTAASGAWQFTSMMQWKVVSTDIGMITRHTCSTANTYCCTSAWRRRIKPEYSQIQKCTYNYFAISCCNTPLLYCHISIFTGCLFYWYFSIGNYGTDIARWKH